MKTIAQIVAEPMTPKNESHLVSNAAGHLTLKHLIADDKERSASPETGGLKNKNYWAFFLLMDFLFSLIAYSLPVFKRFVCMHIQFILS